MSEAEIVGIRPRKNFKAIFLILIDVLTRAIKVSEKVDQSLNANRAFSQENFWKDIKLMVVAVSREY